MAKPRRYFLGAPPGRRFQPIGLHDFSWRSRAQAAIAGPEQTTLADR